MSTVQSAIQESCYSVETPFLLWANGSRVQRYEKANPAWIAACTSLWTDDMYRSVWKPHGDAGFVLIHMLLYHIAQHSVTGIVCGEPACLQDGLEMAAPPDVLWLVEAGWVRYISLAEKRKIENALAAARNQSAHERDISQYRHPGSTLVLVCLEDDRPN